MANNRRKPPSAEQMDIGTKLLDLCREIAEDGKVSLDEIKSLRRWLRQHRGVDLPAIRSLSEIMGRIVADRVVTSEEQRELLTALHGIANDPDVGNSIAASSEELARKRTTSSADRDSITTDTGTRRSQASSVRRSSQSRGSARSNQSFREYAPLTLGVLAGMGGFIVALLAFAHGRIELLLWIGMASGVLIIAAVVWWISRYRWTVVHIQRKYKDWSTVETGGYSDDWGGAPRTTTDANYRYLLDTDHGVAQVSKSLYRRVEEDADYRVLAQHVDGGLHVLSLAPAKRVR
ncbi:MAG: hypothetical protein H8E44_38245 [Planctomycetes bacterium]|nr:hypothetical protein [Planctomycetota bacterium]